MKTVKFYEGEKIELQVSVLVYEQGDYYVAYCPSLELSSYGVSIADAKVGFDDAMNIFLDHCIENGTLKKDLMEHGWILEQQPERLTPPSEIKLNIPGGLLKSQFNENWQVPMM